jgi:hypothetical protein
LFDRSLSLGKSLSVNCGGESPIFPANDDDERYYIITDPVFIFILSSEQSHSIEGLHFLSLFQHQLGVLEGLSSFSSAMAREYNCSAPCSPEAQSSWDDHQRQTRGDEDHSQPKHASCQQEPLKQQTKHLAQSTESQLLYQQLEALRERILEKKKRKLQALRDQLGQSIQNLALTVGGENVDLTPLTTDKKDVPGKFRHNVDK